MAAEKPRISWDAATRILIEPGALYGRSIRLKNGATLLSCQSNEGRDAEQMVVYIGDKNARNFAARSIPFDLPRGVKGQWNSLFAKGESTVTALSSANIEGKFGLWPIDGRVENAP